MIDRKTPDGFGTPGDDKRLFNNIALYDAATQGRKCLLCDYERNKRQWYKVFGRIASTRGYESRAPNERRGILLNDKYSDPAKKQLPENLTKTQIADLQNERIGITNKTGKLTGVQILRKNP